MNKSLKLAELMGWGIEMYKGRETIGAGSPMRGHYIRPYEDCEHGLAQFAAILLKFPEVMNSFSYEEGRPDMPPTQANILDEVLRMKGVEI